MDVRTLLKERQRQHQEQVERQQKEQQQEQHEKQARSSAREASFSRDATRLSASDGPSVAFNERPMPPLQLNTRLSNTGYSVSKDALGHLATNEIKRDLTVTPFVPGAPPTSVSGPPPSFPLWLESESRLYVPKYYGLSTFGVPDKDVVPDGADVRLTFAKSLRQEQMAPVNAFLEAAEDPKRRGGILSLPCGSGKTVIALHIVARIGKKTLIVVHKDFLLQQWRERIDEFLPGARVGTVKAKTVDVADKDIVIASLQSLSMKTYDPALFSDVGLFVVDEVHRTGTEVFSRVFHKTNVKRSLGLSATVNRKDGMTKVFVWYMGDVLYAIESRKDSVRVCILPYFDDSPSGAVYREEPQGYGGKPNMSRMINNVTSHPPRTSLIVERIRDLLEREPSRRVLVLSDRKDQLRAIAASLTHDGDTGRRKISNGFYIGGMKPEALEESQGKDVILATFSFASEGFDVPGLDTLVLASPKTDIEQSVGRILRQKESDRVNKPLIIDVVDTFSLFEAQATKRRRYYKKRGYEIRMEQQQRGPKTTNSKMTNSKMTGGTSPSRSSASSASSASSPSSLSDRETEKPSLSLTTASEILRRYHGNRVPGVLGAASSSRRPARNHVPQKQKTIREYAFVDETQ